MPGIVWRQPRLLRPQIGGRVLCAAGITTASAARGEEVPAGCRARRYAECAQVSSAFHASDAQQGGGGWVVFLYGILGGRDTLQETLTTIRCWMSISIQS